MAGGGVEYIPLFDQLCIIFLQVSCWMINYTAQFTEIHYLKFCVKNSEIRKHFWNQIVWPLCFDQLCFIFLQALCRIINYLAHCGSHRSIGRIFNTKMWNLILGLGTRRTSFGPKWSILVQNGPNWPFRKDYIWLTFLVSYENMNQRYLHNGKIIHFTSMW